MVCAYNGQRNGPTELADTLSLQTDEGIVSFRRVALDWEPSRLQRGPYTGRGAKPTGLVSDRTRLRALSPHTLPNVLSKIPSSSPYAPRYRSANASCLPVVGRVADAAGEEDEFV